MIVPTESWYLAALIFIPIVVYILHRRTEQQVPALIPDDKARDKLVRRLPADCTNFLIYLHPESGELARCELAKVGLTMQREVTLSTSTVMAVIGTKSQVMQLIETEANWLRIVEPMVSLRAY